MSDINVSEPTLKHCEDLLGGSCHLAVKEYYNWFIIKYGNADFIYLKDEKIFDPYAKLRYFRWCERYVRENTQNNT